MQKHVQSMSNSSQQLQTLVEHTYEFKTRISSLDRECDLET